MVFCCVSLVMEDYRQLEDELRSLSSPVPAGLGPAIMRRVGEKTWLGIPLRKVAYGGAAFGVWAFSVQLIVGWAAVQLGG